MLRLPRKLYEETIAHCQREYPKEACGIFAGNAGLVEQVYQMTNVDASPISYQMDPKEQLQVMKRMRTANQQMLAIYHSHTASAAYPSPVDVGLAVYPEAAYVLVSLKDDVIRFVKNPSIARIVRRWFSFLLRLFHLKPDMHSYRIENGIVRPDDLQISE